MYILLTIFLAAIRDSIPFHWLSDVVWLKLFSSKQHHWQTTTKATLKPVASIKQRAINKSCKSNGRRNKCCRKCIWIVKSHKKNQIKKAKLNKK